MGKTATECGDRPIFESLEPRLLLDGSPSPLWIDVTSGDAEDTAAMAEVIVPADTGVAESASLPGEFDTEGGVVANSAPALDVLCVTGWYSAGTHGSGLGELLLEIPDDGSFSEPRGSGLTTLLVSFSKAIDPATFTADAIEVYGLNARDSLLVDLSGVDVATSTRNLGTVGVVEFGDPLPDMARYLVQVIGVRDGGGNALEGDNDRVIAAVLGDVTGDLRVNSTDVACIRSLRGTSPIDPDMIFNVRCDVTLDGGIDNADVNEVKAVRGHDARSIAAPRPADPVPAPLDLGMPFASLIYRREVAAEFDSTSETRPYIIEVEPGQIISVRLVPEDTSIVGCIALYDPDGQLLGTAAASAAGQPVALNTVPAGAGGVYTIGLTNLSGGGHFQAEVILNAALEAEPYGGPANDTMAAAQDIDATGLGLGGSADRLAVLGEAVGDDEDYYAFTLAEGQFASVALECDNGEEAELALYDASGTLAALGAAGAMNSTRQMADFAADSSGVHWVCISGAAGEYTLVVTRGGAFERESNADLLQADDIAATGQVLGSVHGLAGRTGLNMETEPNDDMTAANDLSGDFAPSGGENSYRAFVQGHFGSSGAGDYYRIVAEPGDRIEVSVDGNFDEWDWADWEARLLNRDGTLLASDWGHHEPPMDPGDPGGDPGMWEPAHFSYTFGQPNSAYAGEYYVEASSGSWDSSSYYLSATLRARRPYELRWADHDDYYSFAVNDGDELVITTTTPCDDPGQPANDLDPMIKLYGPGGTLVSSTNNGAGDDRNARTTHTVVDSGTYTVCVTAADAEGDYTLQVTGATGETAGALEVASTSLDGVSALSAFPETVVVEFSSAVLLTSVSGDDLTINGQPANGFDPIDSHTVAFDVTSLAGGNTNYNVSMAEGAVTDLRGNGSEALAHSFSVAAPWERKSPEGAMIYAATMGSFLTPTGDTDSFTFDLDPNQVITVVLRPLEPALSGSVELFDPTGVSLGSAAGGAGEPVIVQTAAASAGGVYRADMTSLAGAGGYEVQVFLNAAVEEESFLTAAANDLLADAQDISASAIALSGGARLAVLGRTEDLADYYAFDLAEGDYVTLALAMEGSLEPGTLRSPEDYAVGDYPQDVAVGDLNGDGHLDLVTVNYNSDNVSVLLGAGDGTFAGSSEYPVADGPRSVALGDFDGDGDLDLVTANPYRDNFSVLPGAGDGTFADGSDYAAADYPQSVALGDLNGDTQLDLITANYYGHSVSALLGAGDGTFSAVGEYAVGKYPRAVALGDLDGDGDLDLVTANDTYPAAVSVLLATDDGTFAEARDYAVGSSPQSVTLGDLNDDGHLDLVTASRSSDNVSVLLGDGDGTFAGRSDYAVGDSPYSAALGDLDGDGDLDLMAANARSDSVSVLLGISPVGLELLDSLGSVQTLGVGRTENLETRITGFLTPEAGMYYACISGDAGRNYSLVVTRGATFGLETLPETVQDIRPSGMALGALGSPTLAFEGKLTASDAAAYDSFGGSVAISGDRLIAGSSSGSGSAYVYRCDGGSWVIDQKLTAFDAAVGDSFGGSVAISGDRLIVGASGDDDGGSNSGSAYVYRYDGGSWALDQKLTAFDGAADDRFGRSVAISSDRVIVGAPYDDDGGSSSGSAYVYRYNGSNWVLDQKLTAFDAAGSDYFGLSAAISGDRLIVGAYRDDDGGSNSGSAYVYRYDGGSWVLDEKLTAQDAASYDYFGESVGISGDRAIVGAYGAAEGGHSSAGSAYLYRYDDGSWVHEQKLTSDNPRTSDVFGGAVAISGDRVIVGVSGDDDGGYNSGSVYLYRYDGGSWVVDQKLAASDAARDDSFGGAVAISDGRVIVGASGDDDGGYNSGSAYIYRVTDRVDEYEFAAEEGDALVITTVTPCDGAAEPPNDLDPSLELRDATGAVIAADDDGAADSRNAEVTYTVPVGGEGIYRVLVAAAGGMGEYTVAVQGATGPLPSLEVVATEPADGVLLGEYPATYRVDFSQSLFLPSVDRSDLLVNGEPVDPAADVIVIDHNTLEFDITSADSGDDTYTVDIAADTISALSGQGLSAFSATFRVDVVHPTVVDGTIVEGDVLPAGAVICQVQFSEPMAVDGLGAEDVTLVEDISGVSYELGNFSYDTAANTATISFDYLPEGEYTLTLISSATGFRNLAELELDGNGDGEPSDYVLHFSVDMVGEASISPFQTIQPNGSLIFTSQTDGRFHGPADVDAFIVDLDAGQVISLVLNPADASILSRMELFAPDGTSIDYVEAPGAGLPAILQMEAVAVAGAYRIEVSAQAGSGQFDLTVLLNAASEVEPLLGTSNDSIAESQTIEGSSVALQGAASRLAVVGQAEAVDCYEFDLAAGEHSSLVLTSLVDGEVDLELLDSAGTLLARGIAGPENVDEFIGDFLASSSGPYYARISGDSGDPYSLIVMRGATFDLEPNNLDPPDVPVATGDFVKTASPDIDGTTYNVWEMRCTTDNDWMGSELHIELSAGSMYQDPFLGGNNTEPDPTLFPFLPTLEWDTYAAAPGGHTNVPSFLGEVTIDASTFLAFWYDLVDTGPGTFRVAQITFSSDAVGTLTGTSADAGNNVNEYEYAILAGEILGGATGQGDRWDNIDAANEIHWTGQALGALRTEPVDLLPAEIGPNNDLATANDLSSSFQPGSEGHYLAEVTGDISPWADDDFFRFLASPGDEVRITLEAQNSWDVSDSSYIELCNNEGTVLASDWGDFWWDWGEPHYEPAVIYYTFGGPNSNYTGDYYVRVDQFAGSGYRLVVDLETDELLEPADPGDFYSFSASGGDNLVISTTTPGGGDGQPDNDLDPRIVLYDTDGFTVTTDDSGAGDGRNAKLSYTVGAWESGTYIVAVFAETGIGDYTLHVTGATGTMAAFRARGPIPRNGQLLTQYPSTYRLDFSQPLLLSSVGPEDLLVNGVPADSVLVIDHDTLEFDITSADSGDGLYTATIAAGAIKSVPGVPNEPFTATFHVDTVGPTVIASSIADGATVPTETLVYQVQFSEPIALPTSPLSSVWLVEALSAEKIYPISFGYDDASRTATITFANVAEGQYTLTVLSDGGFEDLSGNLLDGAPSFPLPSGDGVSGDDFVVHFDTDRSTEAYGRAFQIVPPAGSLVYTSAETGLFNAAGDTDSFALDLDGRQKVTIRLTPLDASILARVELRDPVGALLGTASALGAGETVILQTMPVDQDGAYTFDVTAVTGSGRYELEILLNSALETESPGQPSNDDDATAEDIDGSFIDLGGTWRGAVLGELPSPDGAVEVEGFESGALGAAWSTYSSDTEGVIQVVAGLGAAGTPAYLVMSRTSDDTYSLNEAVWTIDLSGLSVANLSFWHGNFMGRDEADTFSGGFTGHYDADGVAISVDGVDWHPVWDPPAEEGGDWQQYTIDLAAKAAATGIALADNFHIKFQHYGATPRLWDEIAVSGGDLDDREDWYSLTLSPGERLTLAATPRSAAELTVELYDDSGMRLALGVEGATNVEGVIERLLVPAAGTYYARVTGDGPYSLVALRDCAFDIETISETAQIMGGLSQGLGYVTPPTSVLDQKLTAYDPAGGDEFGQSVAISGHVAIVGARNDDDGRYNSGSAYVYRYDGGTWILDQKLTAFDAASSDYFGCSVAISGDRLIVGADGDDDGGSNSGSVYVYGYDGASWVLDQKLTAFDAAAGDYFGQSVAINGDRLIVGSSQDDDGGYNSGSVYVYGYDGAGWIPDQKLTALDAAGSDYFGRSVAISGDQLIVGAYYDDDGGSNSGSAYVYRYDGGSWVLDQKLTAQDAAGSDYFGLAVAISDDRVIVGAYGDDDGGYNSGSAYVYGYDGGSWVLDEKLTAQDAGSYDNFGESVGISGDRVIVGAYGDDDDGSGSGSAYVYRYHGGGWVLDEKLTAADATGGDYFGQAVAISGDRLIVGAYRDDDGGSNSGSAYVYGPLYHVDGYTLWAEAGDSLVIATATPGDAGGEPDNDLDPWLNLYDELGQWVAGDDNGAPDGRNASIAHTVAEGASGLYTVVVSGDRGGEYVLTASGASPGAEARPYVVSTSPSDAEPSTGPPEVIDVVFSEGIRTDSLDLVDLTVDGGVAVTGAEFLDGRTVRFTVDVPNVEHTYHYTLPGGAVVDLQNQPNEEYHGSFVIDHTGPRIIAQTPATQTSSPFVQWTFTFSEEVDPETVRTDDIFGFTAPDGSSLLVEIIDVTATDSEVTVTFTDQVMHGTYTMLIGPGIYDIAGNPMDQDGNGIPGEDTDLYTATVELQSPDLLAESVIASDLVRLGGPMDVTWTVRNIGTDPAIEGWGDCIWLSDDIHLSQDDIALLPEPVPGEAPLAAGNHYDRITGFTVPETLSPGTYFVILQADALDTQAESDEANNTAVPAAGSRPGFRRTGHSRCGRNRRAD